MFFYSIIGSSAIAASFGNPVVRSYLGQPLNAQVPISGVPQEDLHADCIKATVETIDGNFIASLRTEFTASKRADPSNSATLMNVISKEPIIEPAVTLSVSLKCGPLMQRTYSLLLDYPEYTTPATVVSAENKAEKIKPTVTPPTTNLATPIFATKKTVAQSTKRTSEMQKAKTVVNPQNSISKKPTVQAPTQDQLKLSNEEIVPTKIPSIVEKPVENPVSIEQQRIEENNLAQERFAAMLRNEPTLLTSQIMNTINNDQQKIQRLETELKNLKLQLQSNIQPVENRFPTSLIIMNAAVLLLVFVLLFVVGKLWLSLRKTHQQNLWWHATPENKQGVKIDEPQAPIEEVRAVAPQVITPPILESQPSQKEVQQMEAVDHLSIFQEPIREDKATLEEGNGAFNLFTSQRGSSIQIEELSDFTQEAEFWVSINNPKRAIEILEPQCLDENLTMPVSLLYLLDLYRLINDENKYTNLRDRLKRKFNISIQKFNESVDLSKVKHLEDYEHVTSRCCAFWNTNYILPYLESLLIDDREGERIGFDLAVYRDILFLISICKELDRTKDVSVTSA